jgi:hypothetical protein
LIGLAAVLTFVRALLCGGDRRDRDRHLLREGSGCPLEASRSSETFVQGTRPGTPVPDISIGA